MAKPDRNNVGNSRAEAAIAFGSLDSCAVHEAGHAVAAQVLSVPHDGATVEPDRCGSYPRAPNPSGETFIIDPRPGWRRVMGPKKPIAQNLAICLYAGRAAELCIFGHAVGGHERDYSEAFRTILWARRENTIGLLDWQTLQRRLVRRADALVRGNEDAVRRVAVALQKRGTLSREEISEIVGLAGPVAPPIAGSLTKMDP
jgi:ATP-dependent Zn protease